MSEISEDELFAMVNLVPRLTGLPMTVWVRPESGLPHDIRIKVNMTRGRSMSVGNLAVVGVRPVLRLIAGQSTPTDFWHACSLCRRRSRHDVVSAMVLRA